MHENRETSATPAAQPGRRSAGEGQSHHPALEKLGINKRIGWHTFRHSFSTLLRHLATDINVQQDLLRHSSARLTLDTYTQAVTPAKRWDSRGRPSNEGVGEIVGKLEWKHHSLTGLE